MKFYLKTFLLFAFVGVGGLVKAQQNIQMTQYVFNSLGVNPAYAGYKEEWFAQLGLRSQWVGLDGAPKTGLLSLDGVTDQISKKHGVGLQLGVDALGAQRLSFGIGAGVTQYSLDGKKLDPNYNDPTVPNGRISDFVPDIRFGAYYYSPSFYLGASVNDILSDDESKIGIYDATTTQYLRRKMHVYLMTGLLVDFGSGVKFRPSLLWKEDFKGPSSLDANASFIFDNKLWLGASWRTGVTAFNKEYVDHSPEKLSKRNAFAGLAQFYVNDRFRVGYSYDYIISQLSSLQSGSHEITLGLTFGRKEKRLLSPRFF
jgi:type IX secretion system PorP/SprF family membrane protein